jgi:gamma-glutamyltranspeptidase/glutathione hydrolase
MYSGNVQGSIFGGLASGVPGEVRGLEYVHKKYGKLPWEQVMMPAVKVAREGFPVSADLVKQMNAAMTPTNRFLETDPTWRIDFAPNGTLVKLGQTMTRQRYADTLETIAKRGADAFYTGPIAETMIRTLKEKNGTMTLGDLKNYTVALRKPQGIEYRGYQAHSCSSPASGSVVLAVMKIMEGYEDFGDCNAVNISTHRLDEAMRFGYGMRTQLGDPSFVDGVEKYQDEMIEAATAADLRGRISDLHTQNVTYYDPKNIEILDTPGTSTIVVADASGLAFSLTTTINLLFGSQIMIPETGVIMNNEMNDFSIPGVPNAFGFQPSEANFIRPGKRPLSSISNTIVDNADGSLYLVIGSAGGSRIITAVIQGLWHVLDQDMTTHDALAAPRMHDQLVPNTAMFEWAYDNATTAYMAARGHNVTWMAPGLSSAQALRLLSNGTFEAAGEPRQVASGGVAV